MVEGNTLKGRRGGRREANCRENISLMKGGRGKIE
jgi:hypothetical protein